MATLTVWKFDTEHGADQAESILEGPVKQELGMAVGAGMGAQPGTSALFAMTSDAVMDRVRDAFGHLKPELVHGNLSAEDEGRLRDVFAAA